VRLYERFPDYEDFPQWMVTSYVPDEGGKTCAEIASLTMKYGALVWSILKRLEAAGKVKRVSKPGRRAAFWVTA
jgi:hypothetical protein